MRDDLQLYYERELTYLRQMSALFAQKYPKIAGRLQLEPNKCEDPHVERLLEAFAFLAARVHLKIDDEFPEITEALLGIVYPHLTRPAPSMSVVEMTLDPDAGVTSGYAIPRGSMLLSRPVNGVPCKFRTCYETTLYPLTAASLDWRSPDRLPAGVRSAEATGALRWNLIAQGNAELPKIGLDRLVFFLDGEGSLVHLLHEMLCADLLRIVVHDPAGGGKIKPVTLPPGALRPMGFRPDEAVLDYPRRSFDGYRVLQEFFAFPDKFLFFELSGLERVWAEGFSKSAEIVFLFTGKLPDAQRQRLEIGLTPKTFRLGTTPVINSFPQTAEPILLDQRKPEYPVTPDVRRPLGLEILSIEEVASIDPDSKDTVRYEPFYALRHGDQRAQGRCYWLAGRRASTREGDDGTEIYLSIVDGSLRPRHPDADALNIRTICSNRDLPARLPYGAEQGDFDLEGGGPLERIVALRKPTDTLRPSTGRNSQWHLISHLSLNYLSLVSEGKDALQQILRLYNLSGSTFNASMIDGITSLRSESVFARVVSGGDIGFARGLKVTMELDEEKFIGGGAYLFAQVIEHFLAQYATINSFSQLVVRSRQRKEGWRQWPPRSGQKILS
ncbi:MAG: type VI secretion system baseplate subunit TssF [Bryobacteraceae bacterium]|nr:type VI secretion system baseplate subunit TssF [Bryobacteraceae bacterium]